MGLGNFLGLLGSYQSGNLDRNGIFEALKFAKEGVVIKTQHDTYFVRKMTDTLDCQKINQTEVTDKRAHFRFYDLSDQIPDLVFPLHIPYDTRGFMGPLSGGTGEYVIFGDGHVENHNLMMS